MSRIRVSLLIIAVSATLLSATLAYAGVREISIDSYELKWRQMTNALLSFAIQGQVLKREGITDSAPLSDAYAEQLNSFEEAMKWLDEKTIPREQLMRHYKLFPLYEELYTAMIIIIDAVARDDSVALANGWAWFHNILSIVKGTINEIERKEE